MLAAKLIRAFTRSRCPAMSRPEGTMPISPALSSILRLTRLRPSNAEYDDRGEIEFMMAASCGFDGCFAARSATVGETLPFSGSLSKELLFPVDLPDDQGGDS